MFAVLPKVIISRDNIIRLSFSSGIFLEGWGVHVFIFRFKIYASCLETMVQNNSQPNACEIAAATNSMFPKYTLG